MSVHARLLDNIECEYKFAVNEAYAASFIHDFCSAFNDWLHEHYSKLPSAFHETHSLERYRADESKVEVEALKNSYFDTPDDLIFARFKAGLRLRSSSLVPGVEQTIKYKSEDGGIGAAHTHIEHNLRVDHELTTPDLTLFAPGVLPPELVALTQEHELISKYQTNFTRTKLILEAPAFVTFEVALDQGQIIAGNCTSPICEVECELKSINHDFLDAHLGTRIYDLDDVRFEFSALISDLLLKVSGAPSSFKDNSLLMQQGGAQRVSAHGVICASIDPVGADHNTVITKGSALGAILSATLAPSSHSVQPQVRSLTDASSVVAMGDLGTVGDMSPNAASISTTGTASSACASSTGGASPGRSGYFGAMEPLTGFDGDNDGLGEGLSSTEIMASALDACDDDQALHAKIAAIVKREAEADHSAHRRADGVIGLEPFSKLKRAVLLATFYRDNQDRPAKADPDTPAELSISAGTRIDLEYYLKAMDDYDHLADPTIKQFTATCETIIAGYTNALGLALLLGTRQHFEDLRDLLKSSLRFAFNHKRFWESETDKDIHRRLCEDPDLSELSMLMVGECSSLYVEFNVNMWIAPFYGRLAAALENKHEPLSLERFKALCRSCVDNSFAIMSAQFIERLVYQLERKADILLAPQGSEYKLKALATQYHLRQAWATINQCVCN